VLQSFAFEAFNSGKKGLVMSEMINPSKRLRPEISVRA
jgi:hypothetical protein